MVFQRYLVVKVFVMVLELDGIYPVNLSKVYFNKWFGQNKTIGKVKGMKDL